MDSLLPYQLKALGFTATDPIKRDGDFILSDDGTKVFISEWLSASPQPTDAELEAVAGDAEALRQQETENADAAQQMPSTQDQLAKIIACLQYLKDNGLDIGPDGDTLCTAATSARTVARGGANQIKPS